MAIEIERGSGPMNTRPDPAIGQDASVDAAEAPVPPKRPFRYSLRGLMLLVTFLAPLIATASGALGEMPQAIMLGMGFMLLIGLVYLGTGCIVVVLLLAATYPFALTVDFLANAVGQFIAAHWRNRLYQFGLRTLLLFATCAGPLIGAMAGVFGERVQSVSLWLLLGTIVLPAGCILFIYSYFAVTWPAAWIARCAITAYRRQRQTTPLPGEKPVPPPPLIDPLRRHH